MPTYTKETDIKFWTEVKSENKVEIKIDIALLIDFLQQKGFYKLYLDNNSIFIRIRDNKISETTREKIKDYVASYITNAPYNLTEHTNNKHLYKALVNASNVYFSRNNLEFLKAQKPVLLNDTKELSYFYFKNCFVKVTASEITVYDYNKLKNPIWERQIKNKDFNLDYNTSDFEIFLENVCKNDKNRYESLQSAIGYLLNSYKDPTQPKAIILCDESLSVNPNGRTGKSRIGEAVGKLKNVERIDGKFVNFKDRFVFQKINLDTQIVDFNDVESNFNFESLFSILTEGITIERKGQKAFTIPFQESPKILISTNYSIIGVGESFKARMYEIEFSDHYSAEHTPIMEFKRRFYEQWNQDDWNRFHTYMMQCAQLYLREGFIPYEHRNLSRKKLEQMTSKEFCEFADEIERGIEFDKRELYEGFISKNPRFGYRQRTFHSYLQIYCRTNKLILNERQSAGKTYMKLEVINPHIK